MQYYKEEFDRDIRKAKQKFLSSIISNHYEAVKENESNYNCGFITFIEYVSTLRDICSATELTIEENKLENTKL